MKTLQSIQERISLQPSAVAFKRVNWLTLGGSFFKDIGRTFDGSPIVVHDKAEGEAI
jgi:hypothetical protein